MTTKSTFIFLSTLLTVLPAVHVLRADDAADLDALKKVLGDTKPLLEGGTKPSDFELRTLVSPIKVAEWRMERKTASVATQAKKDANTQVKKDSGATGTASNAVGYINAVGISGLANLLGVSIETAGLTQAGQTPVVTVSGNAYGLLCKSFGQNKGEDWGNVCYPSGNPLRNITFSASVKTPSDPIAGLNRPFENLSNASVAWQSDWHNPQTKLQIALQRALDKAATAFQVLDAAYPPKCKVDAEDAFNLAYGSKGFKDDKVLLAVYRNLEARYAACGTGGVYEEKQLGEALAQYSSELNTALAKAKRNWVVSASYNFVRQYPVAAATAAATGTTATPTAALTTLPSLSSFGVAWKSGEFKRAHYSGSFVATAFNQSLPGSTASGLRDIRITNEFDVLLIDQKKSFADGLRFSISGIYLDLRREPLGQKVMLSGRAIATTGKMGVVQGKLTLPAGDTGMKIPLSVSWASRTELLPDKEWKAGIGLTFDWRQLIPVK